MYEKPVSQTGLIEMLIKAEITRGSRQNLGSVLFGIFDIAC